MDNGYDFAINEDWEKLPAAKNGEWEHTLFSCCKIDWIGEFVLALFMPCLYDCTVAGGIAHSAPKSLIAFLFPCSMCWFRKNLREKRKINSTFGKDVLITMFCHPCSSVQMKREIVLYAPNNQPNANSNNKPDNKSTTKTDEPLSTKQTDELYKNQIPK